MGNLGSVWIKTTHKMNSTLGTLRVKFHKKYTVKLDIFLFIQVSYRIYTSLYSTDDDCTLEEEISNNPRVSS